jgi:hypothetical protein
LAHECARAPSKPQSCAAPHCQWTLPGDARIRPLVTHHRRARQGQQVEDDATDGSTRKIREERARAAWSRHRLVTGPPRMPVRRSPRQGRCGPHTLGGLRFAFYCLLSPACLSPRFAVAFFITGLGPRTGKGQLHRTAQFETDALVVSVCRPIGERLLCSSRGERGCLIDDATNLTSPQLNPIALLLHARIVNRFCFM